MTDTPQFTLYREPPRRALTARNLEDYDLCPQKYLLSFFQPPRETGRALGGPAALHQAVRAALLELDRAGGPEAVPEARLLEWFEAAWEGGCCADSLEEEQLHAQGLAMLRRYREARAGETARVLATDLRLEAEIGGHPFVAVADRVEEAPDGTLTLLRYKTTRRPPGPGELAGDLSAGVLLLVGERHFGRPVEVAICAVRSGQTVRADFPPDARKELEARLSETAERLRRATDYPPRRGKACRACRSRAQCPAWHPAPEPAP
jgi:RecB family exonuclease